MTRYAKRKLKYSLNENFNLLPYVEWDRFVTPTGAQAEWGLRYRIYIMVGTNILSVNTLTISLKSDVLKYVIGLINVWNN